MFDLHPVLPAPGARSWIRRFGVLALSAVTCVGAISPSASAGMIEDAVGDPFTEARLHLREANEDRQRGLPVAAADHLEAAFRLLTDARRWRDARGELIAKLYETLLAAHDQAATDDEKVDHLCRLRGLLVENIADLREAFGDEADALLELHHGEEKVVSLTGMIEAHGDPDILCAAPGADGPLPTMPTTTVHLLERERSTGAETSSPVGTGPEVDAVEIDRSRRRAVAMTASGASLLVAGGALLGAMGYYLAQGRRYDQAAQDFDPHIKRSDEAIAAHNAVLPLGIRANNIAYGTGFVGGASLIAGALLTTLGRRRLRSNALSIVPGATPTSASAALTLRF